MLCFATLWLEDFLPPARVKFICPFPPPASAATGEYKYSQKAKRVAWDKEKISSDQQIMYLLAKASGSWLHPVWPWYSKGTFSSSYSQTYFGGCQEKDEVLHNAQEGAKRK